MSCSNDSIKNLDKDFWRIVDSSKYIDKSLMIKTLLDSPEHMILISAPPGFFKRTNTLMLKCFFGINDANLEESNNDSVRLWKNQVFRSMKIGKHTELLDKHLSRYPVLHLKFHKIEVSSDEVSFLRLFQSALQSALSEFSSVQQSAILDSKERKEFHKLACCKLSDSQLGFGIKKICKLFRKHFNEKVIVLIDHYDDLIIRQMSTDGVIEPVVEFLKTVYVGLQDDSNINFVLLTGETNLFKIEGAAEYCFPNYNKFTQYYGIILEDIRSFDALEGSVVFDGHGTGDSKSLYCTNTSMKKLIYFPWLVLDQDYGFYFSRLPYIMRGSVVLQNSTVRSILQRLLLCEKVAIKTKKHFNGDDVYKLRDLCSKCPEKILDQDSYLSDESIEVFFSFLARLGVIAESIQINDQIKKQFGFQACSLYYVPNELANVVLLTSMY